MPPDAPLLASVLQAEQTRAWIYQLTPVFFDRAARGQVLEAVRAGLPALAPALDAEGLKQLGDGVIQELCRRASQDARRPPREAAPAFAPLQGPALGREILAAYPFPIAAAYRVLNAAEGPAAAFVCLLRTFESVIHYLATVAVSAYLRSDLTSAECNHRLLEYLLRDRWSTGVLYGLLRDTTRLAGGGPLPYSELRAYLFDARGRPTSANDVLESFITLRNEELGHGGEGDDDYFDQLLEPNRRRLEEELAHMPWLARWSLIRPVEIADGRVVSADLLNGADRFRRQPFELALEDRDREGPWPGVRADRDSLLLVAPDRGAYLPLFPLARFFMREQAAFFLQGVQWDSGQVPPSLARATWVAYLQQTPRRSEPRGEYVCSSLEHLVARLRGSACRRRHARGPRRPAGPGGGPRPHAARSPAGAAIAPEDLRRKGGRACRSRGLDRRADGGPLPAAARPARPGQVGPDGRAGPARGGARRLSFAHG